MQNLLAEINVEAYPSLAIPIDIARNLMVHINAVFQTGIDQERGRYLIKTYWIIICENERFVFTKNKTWVQNKRHKTDKFRAKIAFDSFEDAVNFAKQNWPKIIKPLCQ